MPPRKRPTKQTPRASVVDQSPGEIFRVDELRITPASRPVKRTCGCETRDDDTRSTFQIRVTHTCDATSEQEHDETSKPPHGKRVLLAKPVSRYWKIAS